MAISVGSVSVDVVPDARKFVPDLRAKLNNLPTVSLPVEAATQAAAAAIDKVAKAPHTATVSVTAETSKAKADVDALQKQIRDKTLALNVSTSDAKAQLARLQNDIAQAKAAVKVNADDTDARAKLEALKKEATDLRAQIELDSAPARAEIAKLKADANRGKVTVQAEADTAKAEAELAKVAGNRTAKVRVEDDGSILSATNRLGALLTAGVALGPAIVPAAAAAAAAVGAIGIGALAGVAGIGTLVLGFSGVSDAVKALSAAQTSAGRDAAKNAAAQVAATEQVRSAEAALVNTRANAADASVRSARAVADAQQGVRDATREASGSVQDALAAQTTAQRGVGDATRAAAASVRDAMAQQVTAQRGVEDAARAAAAGVRDALRQQVDAQRAVEDATRAASRSVADALFAQQQAEQSLARAQADARQAQLSLTQAREDARQSLEDLTLQVEDGALAQRRAVLSVQDAQDNLNKTLANPKATERQRQQAQLSYDEAMQNLDEIAVRNQRLAKQKADADKAGINGSKQVQAATAGIATAEQRVQDARTQAKRAADSVTEARVAGEDRVAQARQRAADADAAVTEAQRAGAERSLVAQQQLARAAQGVAEARRAGDERILVARQALAKAEQNVADARIAGDRRIADAQAQVSQAVASQVSQQRQSAAAIAQAQAAVATAHRQAAAAATAQSASLTKVDDAMKALSPAGKTFALFLFSLRHRFDELKATAQEGLLPGVQSGIQSLLPLLPTLNRIVGNAAKAMGELFAQAGKALTSPFWRDFFNMIANTVGPNLKVFGGVILNLAQGFAGLLMAFQPLNAQLGAGLLNLSQRFAEFGAGASKSGGFQAFMAYVQQVGPLIISTIRSLATTIGRIVVALAPIGPIVLSSIGFLADVINRVPIDVLRILAVTIGGLVLGFRLFSAAIWLVNVAMEANPIGLIVIGLAALGAGLVIAYRRSDTFRRIVDQAWTTIKNGADAAWKIIRPILTSLGAWMGTTLPDAFKVGRDWMTARFNTVRDAISDAWSKVIHPAFKAMWDFVSVSLPGAFKTGRDWMTARFNTVRDTITDAWSLHIKPTFDAIWTFISVSLPAAFKTGRDWISARFNTVRDAITNAWTLHIKPAFDAISDALTVSLPKAFESGVTAIKSAWDKIKEYAKAPVRFVMQTVLDNGIIAAFNKVNKTFGNPVTPIKPITPAGFARGTEDHRAQIAHPNQPRLWAEPETGGEAYIPLAPSKRPRSAQILGDVARRFGYGLVRMANGGTLITAGRHLRDLGYTVGEGPDGFGPIHHVHAAHSRHYDGMALDINHGAGTSKTEQAALSRIVPYLQGLGLRIIFMAPGHYNHLHAEVPRAKGLASQIGGMVKGAAGAVADFLDPRQLIEGPLNSLLSKLPGRDSPFGKIVAGAPRSIATMLINKAKEFVGLGSGDTKDFSGGGGGEFGGGSGQWRGIVTRVVAQLGQPASAVDAVLRRIQFESGGRANAVNRWDSNARAGHPSQGLMQVIPGTFAAYAGPYRGRGIQDPLANIYAGANYALHRYHSLAAIDPRVRPRGYDAGGFLQPGLTTVYNGTGKPEPVFTAEQWATLRNGGGQRAGLTINGDVHTASVEEFMREAGARQRLDEALHPLFA